MDNFPIAGKLLGAILVVRPLIDSNQIVQHPFNDKPRGRLVEKPHVKRVAQSADDGRAFLHLQSLPSVKRIQKYRLFRRFRT